MNTNLTHDKQATLILDTNIVLDLLLFKDAHARAFQSKVQLAQWRWIATPAMRDELSHILTYPHLIAQLAKVQENAQFVLNAFDQKVEVVAAAPAIEILCQDSDDQKFIDLAFAHKATLVSKDKQVLKLKRKLAKFNVRVLDLAAFANLTAIE